MEKMRHEQVQSDEKHKVGFAGKLATGLKRLPECLLRHSFAILFFAVLWALLAFYEPALLFRVNELSLFLYDDMFYNEMVSVPAGHLYYVASWFVQFFYHPATGAAIYVVLLALVYRLTYRVFDIKRKYSYVALLPVVALLASNTQLGYWIFYLKIPGYYYVALLAVIISLLAAWVVKISHLYLKPFLVVAWIYFAYPYIGVYAIVSGVIIGIHSLCLAIGRRKGVKGISISAVTMVVAAVMAYLVPPMYYKNYTSIPIEEVYTAGVPASQWKREHVPDNERKEEILSIVDGLNGRVGYPVEKELIKFKFNIEGAFSEKAFGVAKTELYDCININRPGGGKAYTFTFIAKDGTEYYLNETGGNLSAVKRETKTTLPESAHFVCVADKQIKSLVTFRSQSGKYLAWNIEQDVYGKRYSAQLVSSPSDGNARCTVAKMQKEGDVQAAGNESLFGVVNLLVFANDASFKTDVKPLLVAGLSGVQLSGSDEPVLNGTHTSALRIEEVGFKPKPLSLSIKERSRWYDVNFYWIPFYLLLFAFVAMAVAPAIPLRCPERLNRIKATPYVIMGITVLLMVGFAYLFWYNNVNFRVENKQNKAMWDEDWELVAELARDTDEPTRQVVMNKNIALLKMNSSGDKMFSYPDGSAEIEAPVAVRLAQTGGKMAYFQYGKFNFCYRWCVEDAVEYGWRFEYLKHAVRSMMLSGEYRLAERYIKILKKTKYYAGWACEMEQFVKNPELIELEKEFKMPLGMTCYDDFLDVDESYVEAYLTKNLSNAAEKMSRVYVEAALASALTRKDSKSFWFFLNYYVNELKAPSLPRHYQEAVLLFLNIDKGRTVQVPQAFIDKFITASTVNRLNRFMQRVSQHKGKTEAEMAPYFKGDFGNTYYYFYFFVRNIKTN